MIRYGLIGKDLSYSQARKVHERIADYQYELLEAQDIEEVRSILTDCRYGGFNIAEPYRAAVTDLLDELSEDAAAVGAVDVVRRMPDGRLKGYNSDMYAFGRMIEDEARGRKCLILGTGGAARACAEELKRRDAAKITFVSRDPQQAAERLGGNLNVIGYDKLFLYYDSDIIINATPVGRMPDLTRSPITEQRRNVRMFTNLQLAVDLNYNPYRTKFLQDARRLTGCHTKSGLEMLILNSLASRNIWMDRGDDTEEEERNLTSVKRKILEDQLNIVAVGMPGSGKTTIFRRYAYELGLKFIDTDEETEKLLGRKRQEVLADSGIGEEVFRAAENIAVSEACRQNGAVIATGGGTVLNPINRDLLKCNGIVVYVKRPLDKLDVKGRPLSLNIGLSEIFNARDRIYRRMADFAILNSRIFGEVRALTGAGNSYNHELKGYVYFISRKINKYLNQLADNRWT